MPNSQTLAFSPTMPITIINQLELPVPETITIAEIKEFIRIERGFPPEKQTLFHSGEPITDTTATLAGLGLLPDSTFVLVYGDHTAPSSSSGHVIRSAAQQTCPEEIDIDVFMEGTLEDVARLRVVLTDTLYNVKQQLGNELRCDTGRLQLGYGWTVLHDDTMVRDIPTMIECKAVELTYLTAEDQTFATLIDIDVYEWRSIRRIRNLIMKYTEAVLNVKEKIENIIGHKVGKHQLGHAWSILRDDTQIRDVPHLIKPKPRELIISRFRVTED